MLKIIKQTVFGWVLSCLFSSNRDRIGQVFINGRCQLIWESEHVGRKIKLRLFETHETRFFEQYIKQGDICFDVGANVGYYTNLFASITGNSGRVFSVEPLPRNVKLIELASAINHTEDLVKVMPVGASSEDTEARFAFDGDSSYASVQTEGSNSNEVTIQVKKIDSIASDYGLIRIDILKMDVEGWEYHALQGMKDILSDPKKRPRLMMIELYSEHLKKYSSTITQICSFLADYGFSPYFLSGAGPQGLLPFTEEQHDVFYNVFFIAGSEI